MIEDVDRARAQLEVAVKKEKRRSYFLRLAIAIAVTAASVVVGIAMLTTVRSSGEKSTVISDQAGVIADQRRTIEDIKMALAKFAQTDACLNAYSRRITETQNTYLTDGFGGLLVAISDRSDQHDALVAQSLVTFDKTLKASQQSVRDRNDYAAAGAQLPCPIPTTS